MKLNYKQDYDYLELRAKAFRHTVNCSLRITQKRSTFQADIKAEGIYPKKRGTCSRVNATSDEQFSS